MRFEEQAILVTGASRGIGRAVALGLGARGATVAVHYSQQEEAATAVVQEIAGSGGAAFAVRADLAAADGPASLAQAVRDGLTTAGREQKLGAVVLNASSLVVGGLGSVSADDIATAFALNVRAPLMLLDELLPMLDPGSRVITVSAAITRWANPDLLVQSAAKAALQDLSRNLAAALGPRGIAVVDVAPGVTRTDLAAGLLSQPGVEAELGQATALGRVAEPEDVADAIIALLGEEARWITGQTIDLSGGFRL